MANGNVQRALITDFGFDDGNTRNHTINAVVVANSFARLTNIHNTSAGPTAGTTTDRANDDLGCTCLLTSATNVALERESTGIDEDVSVALEVIELPSSGNDAAVVRMHQDIVLADGVLTSDTAIPGVSTIGDCVPIICGVRSDNVSTSLTHNRLMSAQIVTGTSKIRLTRGDNTGQVTVSVAVVEWIGSNYSVQQNISHTQTIINTVETESTLATVNWAQTIIFSSMESSNNELHHTKMAVFPGVDGDSIKFQSGSTANKRYVHLVTNSNLVVKSIDSLDGSETVINADGSDPMVVDKAISPAIVLADNFVIASTSFNLSAANMTVSPYNYYLTITTNLRWWITQSASNLDYEWAAQLIDISGLVEDTGPSAHQMQAYQGMERMNGGFRR